MEENLLATSNSKESRTDKNEEIENDSSNNLHISSIFPKLKYAEEEVSSRTIFSRVICERLCGENDVLDTLKTNWMNSKVTKPLPIAIIGQTQIGKTQFLKELFNNLKNEFNYIFYVSFHNCDLRDNVNLLQFLTKKDENLPWIDFPKKNVDEKYIEVVRKIKDDKVCVIFDQLEKSNLIFDKDQFGFKEISLEYAPASHYISYILYHGFGNWQRLIVLNPWHYWQYHRVKPDHKIIYIQGIGYQEQSNEIQMKCNRSDCKTKTYCLGGLIAKHEVETCPVCKTCYQKNCHSEIQSLGYAYFNRKVLLLNTDFHQKSLVAIAANLFLDRLSDIFKFDSADFEKVSCFAWAQYAKGRFLFCRKELLKSGMSTTGLNLFFSCKRESKSDAPVFFFWHVLLQEFLAAQWLFSVEDFDTELEKNTTAILDQRFSVIVEFMSTIYENTDLLKKCKNCEYYDFQPKNFEKLKKRLKKEEQRKKKNQPN